MVCCESDGVNDSITSQVCGEPGARNNARNQVLVSVLFCSAAEDSSDNSRVLLQGYRNKKFILP